MSINKHVLAGRRRDRQRQRSTAIAGSLVTPGRSTRGSWWTTASREGFTAQALKKDDADPPRVGPGATLPSTGSTASGSEAK